MERVFITGIGVLSSLGLNADENLASLRAGRSGIKKAKYFQSKYTESLYFAEIDLDDEQLRERCGEHGNKELTRTALIAMTSFQEAVNDSQLTQLELSDPTTAFISSSTVGGMCYTDHLYADANMKDSPSDYVRSYEGSDHTLRIVRKFNLKGFTDTINTACSSSANAIMLGAKLIKSGRAKRVIVGGADCLAKYTVNGFNSLMILSEKPCKPFDVDRDGLTLGEGAAYLVLECQEFASQKRIYAEVTGYGNSSDAFHPSATSDEATGPITAMKRALESAKLSPEKINYVNAHGTGTQNNDSTESVAFAAVFDQVPPYNSTKSYTGHTLAASGAIESIFSIFSIIHSELYPSLNCENPLTEFNFRPIDEFCSDINIKHAMSNSFGFGGNCTSLILSKCI